MRLLRLLLCSSNSTLYSLRIDSHGLLDRVFPVPIESSGSTNQSHSLRALLQDCSQYPLWVLRVCVLLIPLFQLFFDYQFSRPLYGTSSPSLHIHGPDHPHLQPNNAVSVTSPSLFSTKRHFTLSQSLLTSRLSSQNRQPKIVQKPSPYLYPPPPPPL